MKNPIERKVSLKEALKKLLLLIQQELIFFPNDIWICRLVRGEELNLRFLEGFLSLTSHLGLLLFALI